MKSTIPAGATPPVHLSIEGDHFEVQTPEGIRMRMSVAAFVQALIDSHSPPSGVIMPDGVKIVIPRGRATIWVCECPPRVRRLKWIAADSPAPFGPEARYRDVTIALPYVIVLAAFLPDSTGRLTLSDQNEAFFRNSPLRSLDDGLCYPALLNCSKFDPPASRPLAWICTQYLKRDFDREKNDDARMRKGFEALLSCLYETGFNYSSEHHELTSWFSESRSVDERIASIEAWEKATGEDRLFPLKVPWLEADLSVRDVVERIFQNHHIGTKLPTSAGGLAGFIMNHADELPSSEIAPATFPIPSTPDPAFPF